MHKTSKQWHSNRETLLPFWGLFLWTYCFCLLACFVFCLLLLYIIFFIHFVFLSLFSIVFYFRLSAERTKQATNKQANKQTGKQTNKQANKQASKQTNMQANMVPQCRADRWICRSWSTAWHSSQWRQWSPDPCLRPGPPTQHCWGVPSMPLGVEGVWWEVCWQWARGRSTHWCPRSVDVYVEQGR